MTWVAIWLQLVPLWVKKLKHCSSLFLTGSHKKHKICPSGCQTTVLPAYAQMAVPHTWAYQK